jgi:hypothetical protein
MSSFNPVNYNLTVYNPEDLPPNIKVLKAAIESRRNWNTHHEPDNVELLYTSNTDYDHFPYRRWYREDNQVGNIEVHQRDAGWRPREDWKYRHTKDVLHYNEYDIPPCPKFQPACSLIRPSIQVPCPKDYNKQFPVVYQP